MYFNKIAIVDARQVVLHKNLYRMILYCCFTVIMLLLSSGSVMALDCGREGQRACGIFERIPSCDPYLVERSGRCIHPDCGREGERACVITERIPSCDANLVESAGMCVLPTPCGGEGQRPCKIWERIPSCNTNLIEYPLGVSCMHPACGRVEERACVVSERIPSCDAGLIEWSGKCVQSGICGGKDQRPCTIAERIPSCNADLIEWSGKCVVRNECGGEGQRPCTIPERIPSCNAYLIEQPLGVSCVHPACGRENERACTVGERLPSCDANLIEWSGKCVPHGICGKEGQRPCLLWERTPSCETNLVEQPLGISCIHPPCGRENERACTLDERLPSCDASLVEWSGKCVRLGDCGGEGQRPCLLWERIPSCNANLIEKPLGVSCVHPSCGREGERACVVTERIPSCDDDLIEAGGRCMSDSPCNLETAYVPVELNLDSFSSPVIRTEPFTVVVLGDSVAWGQGLIDQNKYSGKLKQWLEESLKTEVKLVFLAHSGAETFPPSGSTALSETNVTPGEVPNTFPTISRQIDLAAEQLPPAAPVDLVILGGCINDIGVMKILNPITTVAEIQEQASNVCGERVIDLLIKINTNFPNARIVLTGYYQILSYQSDLTAIGALLAAAGVVTAAGAAPLHIPTIDPVTQVIVGPPILGITKAFVALNTLGFYTASTKALANAARITNNRIGGKVSFACPPFHASNSFAAPQSLLWSVPIFPSERDEKFTSRVNECHGDLKCENASAGHPNHEGAHVYFDAIRKQIEPFIPTWKARMASLQSAQCSGGVNTCIDGYVWRDAFPGDYVCVTGQTRDQTANDNAHAAERRDSNCATGNCPYGLNQCLPGYVWREASSDDYVCVSGDVRTQAAYDNSQAAARRNPQCAATPTSGLEIDTDRWGMDYKRIDMSSGDPNLCQQECKQDSGCKAFTYVKPGIQGPGAVCYLKSGIPDKSTNTCCVSGVWDH